jgi:hypothetical protein
VHMCIYHASHGHRTCTYVVHATCLRFPRRCCFCVRSQRCSARCLAFPTLFTEGARATPEKKWGALGACHALNAPNARIFFSRCTLPPPPPDPKSSYPRTSVRTFLVSLHTTTTHHHHHPTQKVVTPELQSERSWSLYTLPPPTTTTTTTS